MHTDDITDSGELATHTEVVEEYCKLPLEWSFSSESGCTSSRQPFDDVSGTGNVPAMVVNSPAAQKTRDAGHSFSGVFYLICNTVAFFEC